MNAVLLSLSPPVRLAVAYARVDLRTAWALLLALDDRIGSLVRNASEPIFAQMKIAWWQDALAKPVDQTPKGEPLLAELRRLEEMGQAADVARGMQQLLNGWELLAANEEWSPDILQSFAELRSTAVFKSYARWVDRAGAIDLGHRWAVDDLSARFGKAMNVPDTPQDRLDRSLRPLSILALSARPNVSGALVVWHALTGR